MATIPGTYDSSGVQIDPFTVDDCAKSVTDAVTGIGDALSAIQDALNALMLPWTGDPSWSGDSANLAQQMNDRWDAVATKLYGTKDDPDKGVLNRVAGGLSAAALNYSTMERAVDTMFTQFGNAVSGADTNVGQFLIDLGNLTHSPAMVAQGQAMLTPKAPESMSDVASHNMHTTAVDTTYDPGRFGDVGA